MQPLGRLCVCTGLIHLLTSARPPSPQASGAWAGADTRNAPAPPRLRPEGRDPRGRRTPRLAGNTGAPPHGSRGRRRGAGNGTAGGLWRLRWPVRDKRDLTPRAGAGDTERRAPQAEPGGRSRPSRRIPGQPWPPSSHDPRDMDLQGTRTPARTERRAGFQRWARPHPGSDSSNGNAAGTSSET